VHSVRPDPARDYSPWGVVACHARPAESLSGPQPSGSVQWRSGPWSGMGCAHRALSLVAQWWLAGGKVLLVSSRGPREGAMQGGQG
jgi:hypothetical protein